MGDSSREKRSNAASARCVASFGNSLSFKEGRSQSHNTGEDAFGFYLHRVAELLVQRGKDAINGEISSERKRAFRDVIKNQNRQDRQERQQFSKALLLMVETELQNLPLAMASFTIQDLLESEFVARGLDPEKPADRQRFVAACQALGMRISSADVDATLAGKPASKTLLGRLRNVLMKERLTGQLYSLEELEQIRDGKLMPT